MTPERLAQLRESFSPRMNMTDEECRWLLRAVGEVQTEFDIFLLQLGMAAASGPVTAAQIRALIPVRKE